MRWTKRREAFRAILEGDDCIFPASVWDPLSARMAEDLGFEAGMFAGSVASLAVLGAPDLVVLTLSEFAEQAGRIGRAAELPLIVDADHGYGNALNVGRTIEELEIAGVAALTIEDTELPQPFGTVGATRLLSVEELAGKIGAALAARRDPGLAIVGRTAATSVTGIEDAILRARACRAAGADALFFTGITTREEVAMIDAALDGPFILGGGGIADAGRGFLAAHGVRVCLQGHLPIRAAVQAAWDALRALRDGTPPGDLDGIASEELMKRLMRDADHRERMRAFLMPKS